jgi:NADH-quinone oxidoreductase subunit F
MDCDKTSEKLISWNEENDCPVEYSLRLMNIVKKETCGQDVLCREGSLQIYEILKDITKGSGNREDYELLEDLLFQIKENVSCEMTKTAAEKCLNLMQEYEEEWRSHIERKRCSKLICEGTYTVYIDPQLCDGCGLCIEACPEKAIIGGEGLIHVIESDKCSKNLKCLKVCPQNAIKKEGILKPKVPEKPVPVGSFSSNSTKGRRRRRRRE